MEATTYLQHYRISTDDQGTPEQVSRSGAAVNYKAADTRSGEPVVLQLIPLAAIDPTNREQFEQRAQAVQKLDHINIASVREAAIEHDRFVFVSEYLLGETADSWVIAHGPLTPDAVLRVALQVVRAIAAAAFHGLTHRAIQPANVIILTGPAPEGGWPFVKLLNFGVAGVELHSASDEARELAPGLPPQFASPEQLRGGEIDFRSEIYSLGATMCFLLAGAVPLAIGGTSVRARLRSLPELRRAPRRLRKLLARMLHENPEMRPQDPVGLEKEIQKALGIAQPGQQTMRSLTPVAPVLPERPAQGPTPLAQVWRGALAFAVLLLLGGIAAAFFYPSVLPWWHRSDIGKPIGVPERSTSSTAPSKSITAVTANQPVTAAAGPPAPQPSLAQDHQTAELNQGQLPSTSTANGSVVSTRPATVAESDSAKATERRHEEPQTQSSAPPAAAETAVASNSTPPSAPAQSQSEAAAPAEGPSDEVKSTEHAAAAETKVPAQSSTEKSADVSRQRTHRSKNKSRVAKSAKSSRRATIDPALAQEEAAAIRRAGQVRANFVGATSDGRLMLRLPSGEIVTVRPRPGDDNLAIPRRQWRPIEEQAPNPDDGPRY